MVLILQIVGIIHVGQRITSVQATIVYHGDINVMDCGTARLEQMKEPARGSHVLECLSV